MKLINLTDLKHSSFCPLPLYLILNSLISKIKVSNFVLLWQNIFLTLSFEHNHFFSGTVKTGGGGGWASFAAVAVAFWAILVAVASLLAAVAAAVGGGVAAAAAGVGGGAGWDSLYWRLALSLTTREQRELGMKLRSVVISSEWVQYPHVLA